jgi:hypothetical protein
MRDIDCPNKNRSTTTGIATATTSTTKLRGWDYNNNNNNNNFIGTDANQQRRRRRKRRQQEHTKPLDDVVVMVFAKMPLMLHLLILLTIATCICNLSQSNFVVFSFVHSPLIHQRPFPPPPPQQQQCHINFYHSRTISSLTTTTTIATTTVITTTTTLLSTFSGGDGALDDNDNDDRRHGKTINGNGMNQERNRNSIHGSLGSISNMERERREETVRRKQRQQEVVIGQTSAQRGAQDYPLNPQATELEYLQQASQVERQVFHFTQQGMEAIQSLQLHQADQAFHNVFHWKPTAYLWQAGIVQYYLNNIQQAATIFASSAQIFETKFQQPATEERIWWDACALKYYYHYYYNHNHPKEQDNQLNIIDFIHSNTPLLPPIPENNMDVSQQQQQQQDDDEKEEDFMAFTRQEHRIVMVYARQLFSAAVRQDYSTIVSAKAKLASLAGIQDQGGHVSNNNTNNENYKTDNDQHNNNNNNNNDIQYLQSDKKLRKLTSFFYLGLFYDAIGDMDQCRHRMKQALLLLKKSVTSSKNNNSNSSDTNNTTSDPNLDMLMQTLPLLHMKARGWLDDDNDDDDEHKPSG